jgi:hypothetical protein
MYETSCIYNDRAMHKKRGMLLIISALLHHDVPWALSHLETRAYVMLLIGTSGVS